jgi:anthranilate synthase component 1
MIKTAAQSLGTEKLVTMHRSLLADLETPISAFLKLCPEGPACLLESAAGGEQVARYSFIGYNPFLTLRGEKGGAELSWRDGRRERRPGKPLTVLKEIMAEFRLEPREALPRFCGGAVGYFSYDIVAGLEPVGKMPPDEMELPEVYLQFMENVVVFDHFTHRVHLLVNQPVQEGGAIPAGKKAESALQEMMRLLAGTLPETTVTEKEKPAAPVADITEAGFTEMVRAAREYISAGDVFQVVLSQRFKVQADEDPFVIYRRLRSVNPSPYMFFLRNREVTLVGASPEMLTRVEGKTVTTRPIAGTRRRGHCAEEDLVLERELVADEKEMAEHVMLVDLGRNDIGRIARYGTVSVREYARVERFSHVMHLVSEVAGELAEGKDAIDALAACFPAGTLTGAPKVRAMQIINELEPTARGPYGGAVGYLDFSGNMDTCITIRTLVIKDGTAYIQTGAGIVADSVPEREYRETLHKAKAMFATLGVETG